MSFERRRGFGGTAAGEAGSSARSGADRSGGRGGARRGLTTLGLAAAGLAAGYLVAATVLFSSPDPGPETLVAVPDLTGRSQEEAGKRAADAGLTFRVTGEIFHPEEPAGHVVAQLPLARQYVVPETEIAGTLSLGPETVTVPDVTGLSETQAAFVLGRLGLGTASQTTPSHRRKGQVIRTEPEAGQKLPASSEVTLVVSEGREVVAVPDLEGRHLADVEVLLARLGLEIGTVTFEPGAVGAPGRVIGQAPPPGFALREGGEVSVRVAGSPSEVMDLMQRRQDD